MMTVRYFALLTTRIIKSANINYDFVQLQLYREVDAKWKWSSLTEVSPF